LKTIDLHIHTTASDGSFSPRELVDYALLKGLSALAITDHDTIGGIKEARDYIAEIGAPLELISGIELSSNVPRYPKDIHILGYGIDENDPDLIHDLKSIVNNRDNHKILSILREEGVDISLEDVLETGYEGIITRANIGATISRMGYADDIKDAFRKYVGKGRPAYIPRAEITPHRAVEIIIKHGGVPVLAHPGRYCSPEELDELVSELTDRGLKGLECLYPGYSKEDRARIRSLAEKYNLFITGGTDFHGAVKPKIDLGSGMGDLIIPYSLLEPLKKELMR
jgi:3',5'-nucleoside bisphosphate phosphatase